MIRVLNVLTLRGMHGILTFGLTRIVISFNFKASQKIAIMRLYMKINEKIFCLPPFISTSWNNVAALHMKEANLIVSLFDGEAIQIPNLKPELLETIFEAHAKYLEQNTMIHEAESSPFGAFPFSSTQGGTGEMELPLKFGIGAMDAWGAALQHNPAQAHMPNLPDEVLEKVRSISKILSPEDPAVTPRPEPHCNCMHCQIARAINQGLGMNDMYQKPEPQAENTISEEDLIFQQWEIKQTDDKLYSVTNRLDTDEKYNVYLGHPVGCTCGKPGCEHILAVLKS